GEADDDDRRLQLDIVDLRMALQQVVDEQPVGRVANAVVEQDQAAEPGALVVVADLVQPEAEALLEIIGPEFVELRVLTSGGEDGVDTEICLRTLAVVEGQLLNVGQLRLTQVLDADDLGLVGRHPCMEKPPSTFTVWPVTNRAAGLARKSTTGATSSGVPKRAIGVRWRTGFVSSSNSIMGAVMFDSMSPGATALTRMPCLAQPTASVLVSWTTPALAAP